MPTTIRTSSRYKPEKDQASHTAWSLLEDLKSANGRKYGTSNSGMEFIDSKLIMEPRKPDKVEIMFYIPQGLNEKYRPYKFLGFMYQYLTTRECIMTDKTSYLYTVQR
jgi:hypothetical protein